MNRVSLRSTSHRAVCRTSCKCSSASEFDRTCQASPSGASRLECFFNVLAVRTFLQRAKNVSLDSCVAGVAQSTDVLALGILFSVQLVLIRGATTLSSLNTLKTTKKRPGGALNSLCRPSAWKT